MLDAGLTAGVSTPDNVGGDVLDRILALRGQTSEDLASQPQPQPQPQAAGT